MKESGVDFLKTEKELEKRAKDWANRLVEAPIEETAGDKNNE